MHPAKNSKGHFWGQRLPLAGCTLSPSIFEIDTEIWKTIPSLEGYYSASSLGRIRRDVAYSTTYVGRILKTWVNKHGYCRISLSIRNRVRYVYVHRLIAEVFIGPRPSELIVNHKNGIKHDNRQGNLEYITHRDNHRHASAMGLKACGERNGNSRLDRAIVKKIRSLVGIGVSGVDVSRIYKISKSTVYKIIRRQTWRTVL